VKLKAHLGGQLDGMASGMGKSPEALLERAVTTLLNLHGYQVEPKGPAAVAAAASTAPGVPPFKPSPLGVPHPTATRVEGVDHKLPVITGIVSGMQAPLQAPQQGGVPELKQVPPTANLRAPELGDEDHDFPTQISMAHTLPGAPSEELGSQPLDSGPLSLPVAAGEFVTSPRTADAESATRFPQAQLPEEEPPFVSDVIAVPPELYAPDAGARSALTEVPVSEETRGGESEETANPLAELTRGLESELAEAPVSEVTQAVESATRGLESDSGVTHGLDEALVSDVTHQGTDSSLTEAPLSEVTHQGTDSMIADSPISELTPTADGPPRAEESDTAAMAPRDVPWESDGSPAPELPPAAIETAREALRLGAAKLPIRTRFVQRIAD
jgi:hypothetical protein